MAQRRTAWSHGYALLALAIGLWAPGATEANTHAAPEFSAVGKDAIPRQVVKTLAQDRRGFLWVATGDGLVRFDGYRFQPLERDHVDPARRNLGWVRAMLAGRDGKLWISTETDGLVSYDPTTDRIDAHAMPGRDTTAAPVLALAEDSDGAIWSGSLGGGLERHAVPHRPRAAKVDRFVHRAGDPDSLPDDRIEALRVDSAGTLWVGSWQGLSRRVAASTRFESVPAGASPSTDALNRTLTGRRVLALLESADRRLWAGTLQGDLVVLDPGSGAGTWLPAPAGGRGAVSAFAQSNDGRVWVGTSRGVEVWDPQSLQMRHALRHDPQRPGSLAANEVTTLLNDQAGDIWVGGLGIGLQRHSPGNAGITMRRAQPERGFDGNVHAALALADGQVWAATSSVPLVALDRQLLPIAEVPLISAKNTSTPAPRIQAMTQGPQGRIWLAADDQLLQLDAQRRVVSRQRHGVGEVIRLLNTPDGQLWLAARDGLFRLAAGAGANAPPQRVTVARNKEALTGAVHAVALAPDGALWAGAASGLYRLPAGQQDGLEPVISPQGEGLRNPVVGGLLFGRDGTLWVDTAVAGLHRSTSIDGASARFDPVSLRHGILNRPFGLNLLEDRLGRIWTQQYVYRPAADQLTELTAADGKDFGMGWFFSYTKSRDGRFLFGGTHGLLVIEPERFDPSSYMPPLAVTSLRVDGERVSTAGLPQRLSLGPEHHGLAIEFAALEFSDPQRIRYAYRLEGIDADWIETRADFRVASYGNLPPGNYTLRVRSTNRSGAWNPSELDIPVSVEPAWWQRRDTRALALATLVMALFALFRWRTRRLRRRQRELEARVHERTQALEATTRALEAKPAELEQASLTDPLSGLHNRRFLQQHIEQDVARALRGAQRGVPDDHSDLLFFLIDIDHFKGVNDELGHPAGDAVIRQIPARLRAVFRSGDHLVRWGGEEFLIVVRDGNRQAAAEQAERARAAIAKEPFVLDDGRSLRCTVSIGFACFPLDPRQPEALVWHEVVSIADTALLRAKQEGRDRWMGVMDVDATRRPAQLADWLNGTGSTVVRS